MIILVYHIRDVVMDELKNLKMQNQSLMEIVEVAKQITSDLDIKHIFKNINYVMRAKFQPFFCFLSLYFPKIIPEKDCINS